MRLILQLGILTWIVGFSWAIDIITPPIDVQVKQGATGTLSCVFSEPVTDCLWMMNGEFVRPGERYTYDHANDGDCSLTISESDVASDDGTWQCQLPKASNYDAVTSMGAKYTVLVTPELPTMWRDGQYKIENKSNIEIVDFANQPNISCQSLNGNPPASLMFKLGYSGTILEGNYSIVNGSLPKTNTSVLELLTPLDASWAGEGLVCVANHPSYDTGIRFTAAFIGHPNPPTEVKAYSTNFPGEHIQVGTSERVDLVCEANSRTPLTYQWMIRPHQSAEWTDYMSGPNTSFTAFNTQIKCVVWSIDVNNTAESNYITIEAVKTETGAIIAIVVVVVVVVILMAAGVYGLYRKKMWCFKTTEHKQIPASDGNKNLEGVRVHDPKPKDGDEAINKEQTESLLKDLSEYRKSADSSHEDGKPIIYADLQFQPAKNAAEPPVKINTEYASVKRPYGIQ